jgi:hypothetical protein
MSNFDNFHCKVKEASDVIDQAEKQWTIKSSMKQAVKIEFIWYPYVLEF